MHKVVEQSETYNFEEFCPECNSYIAIQIDENEHKNYEVTCPVCKRALMLCTLCKWDYQDVFGGTDYPCDWDKHNGCYRQRKEK